MSYKIRKRGILYKVNIAPHATRTYNIATMQHLVPRCLLNSQQTTQSATLGAWKFHIPMQCRLTSIIIKKSYGFKTQSHHPICPLSTSKKKTAVPYPHYCVKRNHKKNHHQPFNQRESHVREATPANRSLPPSYSLVWMYFYQQKKMQYNLLVNFHSTRSIFYPPWFNLLRERRGSISPRHTPLSATSALFPL